MQWSFWKRSQREGSAQSDEHLNDALSAGDSTTPSTANIYIHWARKSPCYVAVLATIAVLCIIIVAVVPPVCILSGCTARPKLTANLPSSRLIVSFSNAQKTVRSLVPAILLDYLDEQALDFNVRIIEFQSANVLEQVKRIIEQQPDLDNLIQDQPRGSLTSLPLATFQRLSHAVQAKRDSWAPGLQSPRNWLPGTHAPLGSPMQHELSDGPIPCGTMQTGDKLGGPSVMHTSLVQGLGRGLRQALRPLTLSGDPIAQYQLDRVSAQGAWSQGGGGQGVVVAVVDTGCDVNHPDLRANLWVNTGEVPGDGIDNDRNGYVDDVNGFDFQGPCGFASGKSTDCAPRPVPQDAFSHGTHCAGIVAAINGNNLGGSGIAPRARIMCLKVFDNFDGGPRWYPASVLKAFDYALRMGAHIVSCSFGPFKPNLQPDPNLDLPRMRNETAALSVAMAAMQAKNMLLIAAAGNENTDLNEILRVGSTYPPCTLSLNTTLAPNVLCVAATDEVDQRWYEIDPSFSGAYQGTNTGSRVVDVGAPGRMVWSSVLAGAYAQKTGSSMATPLTAGTAALVMSLLGAGDSGNYFKGRQARALLLSSADRLPSMAPFWRSGARINASRAVTQALSSLQGVADVQPLVGYNASLQSVLRRGLLEAYYALPLDTAYTLTSDVSDLTPFAQTIRARTQWDSWRFTAPPANAAGQNLLVLANATINITAPGLYSMRLVSTAPAATVAAVFGSTVVTLSVQQVTIRFPTAGFYLFELRVLNPLPASTVDIRLSSPASPQAFAYPSYFLASWAGSQPGYPAVPAPTGAMSSVFQVLYSPLTLASPAAPLRPQDMVLDRRYNYTAVLEDVAFGTQSALATALPMPQDTDAGGMYGVVYTRFRRPASEVSFSLACTGACQLVINQQLVMDTSALPPTSTSTCMFLGTAWDTHDLLLRFVLPPRAGGAPASLAAARLSLAWSPCVPDAVNGASTSLAWASIKASIVNPYFWKPQQASPGYASGMQCEVWPSSNSKQSIYTARNALNSPYLRFRLPAAMAGNERSFLSGWQNQPPTCRANRAGVATDTLGNTCTFSFPMVLRDVYSGLTDDATKITGTILEYASLRCWTYMRRPLLNNAIGSQDITPTLVVSVGSQRVWGFLDNVAEFGSVTRFPFQGSGTARPYLSSNPMLNGYYQLVMYESRNAPVLGTVGLREGLEFDDYAKSDVFSDMQVSGVDMLVPLEATPPAVEATLGPPSLRLVQYQNAPSSFTEARAPGYNTVVFHRLNWQGLGPPEQQVQVPAVPMPAVAATVTVQTGLNGNVVFSGLAPPGASAARYVRATGFFRNPLGDRANVTLRVTVGANQAVALTLGGVSVVSGVQFPATMARVWVVQVNLPAGSVPADLIIRSNAPTNTVTLDIAMTSPTLRQLGQAFWFAAATAS